MQTANTQENRVFFIFDTCVIKDFAGETGKMRPRSEWPSKTRADDMRTRHIYMDIAKFLGQQGCYVVIPEMVCYESARIFKSSLCEDHFITPHWRHKNNIPLYTALDYFFARITNNYEGRSGLKNILVTKRQQGSEEETFLNEAESLTLQAQALGMKPRHKRHLESEATPEIQQKRDTLRKTVSDFHEHHPINQHGDRAIMDLIGGHVRAGDKVFVVTNDNKLTNDIKSIPTDAQINIVSATGLLHALVHSHLSQRMNFLKQELDGNALCADSKTAAIKTGNTAPTRNLRIIDCHASDYKLGEKSPDHYTPGPAAALFSEIVAHIEDARKAQSEADRIRIAAARAATPYIGRH